MYSVLLTLRVNLFKPGIDTFKVSFYFIYLFNSFMSPFVNVRLVSSAYILGIEYD